MYSSGVIHMIRNWLLRSLRPGAVPVKNRRQGGAGKKTAAGKLFVERLEERTTPSVTLGVSFDGMNTTNNSCNCQPPDTIAAAGPNHVVELVNTAIEVFNKTGAFTSAPE